MTDNQILPRRDLRIEAFRKYEKFIATACSQTLYINPQVDMDPPLSPATFAARFRDAILAKKRFNYPSFLIPPTFDISNLEAQELTDGRVLIKNKTEIEPIVIEEKKGITEQTIIEIMTDIALKKRTSYELSVSGGEELGRVLAWAAKNDGIDCVVIAQNGKAFFYNL